MFQINYKAYLSNKLELCVKVNLLIFITKRGFILFTDILFKILIENFINKSKKVIHKLSPK